MLCDCHTTWILPILENYFILETDIICESPIPTVNGSGLTRLNESLLDDHCPGESGSHS